MRGVFFAFSASVICLLISKIRLSLAQLPLSPGAKSGIMGAFQGTSDFKIRIHAPVEDTDDVLEAIDSLVRIEENERRLNEEEYIAEKQRILNIQKSQIGGIVQSAFEPLHAMIPNPIRSEVAKRIRDYYHPRSFFENKFG